MRVRLCLERSEKTGVVFLASQRLIRKLSRTQSCLFTRKFAFSLSLSSLTFKFVCWPELLHSPCLHSHRHYHRHTLFACSGTQNCLWIRCFAFLTGNVPMFEHFPFKLLWNSLQRSFRWQGGGRRHCELPPISSRHKYVQTKYFSTDFKRIQIWGNYVYVLRNVSKIKCFVMFYRNLTLNQHDLVRICGVQAALGIQVTMRVWMILKTMTMLLVIKIFLMILMIFFRLFDTDESGNIELDEMFEIVATFYDMEVKIFPALWEKVQSCFTGGASRTGLWAGWRHL